MAVWVWVSNGFGKFHGEGFVLVHAPTGFLLEEKVWVEEVGVEIPAQ